MKLDSLKKEIARREKANNMAPFPVYDREVIQDFKVIQKTMERSKDDYDELKVDYCKTCLSLSLKDIKIPSKKSNTEEDCVTYCTCCGNTDVGTAITIFEWEEMYREKYKENFLKK